MQHSRCDLWQHTHRLIMKFVQDNRMLEAGDRVLAGVSGGPDSLLLLHWLDEQRERLSLELFVGHFHHDFRGAEADEDERFVHAFCARRGIPCLSAKQNVSGYADEHKMSKQAAARECRYAFFEQAAGHWHIDKLALAHHADDQLETLLMRLLRGAGLSGLSGMKPVRDSASFTVIRPLLVLSKEHILRACQQLGLEPRHDASNEDRSIMRNRLRHDIIPLLKRINPQLTGVIREMSEVLQEEDAFLQQLAQQSVEQIVLARQEGLVTVSRPLLQQMDTALQRRVVLLLLSYTVGQPHRDWKKVHIDDVLHVLHNQNEGYKQLSLPYGVVVEAVYDRLKLTGKGMREHKNAEQNPISIHKYNEEDSLIRLRYDLELPLDGLLRFPLGMIKCEVVPVSSVDEVRALMADAASSNVENGAVYTATFDVDQLQLPLRLRTRRTGDHMTLFGMHGSKKVKNLFIDHKMEPALRTVWPIVTDQANILWIPGVRRSDQAKLSQHTTTKACKIKVWLGEGYRR